MTLCFCKKVGYNSHYVPIANKFFSRHGDGNHPDIQGFNHRPLFLGSSRRPSPSSHRSRNFLYASVIRCHGKHCVKVEAMLDAMHARHIQTFACYLLCFWR